MEILRGLVDGKLLNILELFLKNPDRLYHIAKVSADSKVSLASSFRLIHSLNKGGIIECTSVGKTKLYKLASSRKTKVLRKLL
ncbi:MAG: hypothetical protein HGA85_00945 [Nanoarchaeota archaeon]|nr:hypothetical protein [Nanoarchaeota archaeon]